jgi:hypothetical protein
MTIDQKRAASRGVAICEQAAHRKLYEYNLRLTGDRDGAL